MSHPHERDAGTAVHAKDDVYPVVFPYKCVFVPKRGRYERTAYLTGDGFARIRELGVAEKEHLSAFRAVFRERVIRGSFRRATTFDILFFEGRLWWPVTNDMGATWGYPGPRVTASDFLEELRKEWSWRDLFGLNPERSMPVDRTRTNRIISTARIIETAHATAAARLQRDLSETILLVGDEVYAVGGEPIYVQRKGETFVASLHPDRCPYRPSGLASPPGQIGIVDTELERGTFQLADQIDLAREATAGVKRPLEEMPTVEVFMPDMIRLSRDDIRTDALFRLAVDDRSSWKRAVDPSDQLADALEALKAAAVGPAHSATTENRFGALMTLTRAIQEDPGWLKDCEDFRYLVRHLKPLMQSMSLRPSNALTHQDDEAISNLV